MTYSPTEQLIDYDMPLKILAWTCCMGTPFPLS